MKQAFAHDYGTSFSVRQLEHNLHLTKGFQITNAVRSQFNYDRYERLREENLIISLKVFEGRGR